jgi:hypothetical protein
MTIYTISYPATPTHMASDKRTATRLARFGIALGYLPTVTAQDSPHSAPRPVWAVRLAVRLFFTGYNA